MIVLVDLSNMSVEIRFRFGRCNLSKPEFLDNTFVFVFLFEKKINILLDKKARKNKEGYKCLFSHVSASLLLNLL